LDGAEAAGGDARGIERAVFDVLDRLGVPYEVLPCDPALADTAAFCAHYGIPPGESANTIVVASRTEPKVWAACLVLATTRLDVNRKMRELLGVRRLSFASPEETVARTGMMVGGVTPFGIRDMPIYVDARIPCLESVVVGGGSRSCKIRVAPAALLRLPGASAVDGLAFERQEPTGAAQE
jgi:prolyl-tRNA editing enzyme YbaK/EbsC (Cys-tRNA(Pro) deacylase)